MVGLDQHVPLGPHVRHLLLFQHVRLAQHLHRVHVPGVLLLHQPHLAECTAPDHLERLEVLHPEPGALEAQEFRLLLGVLHALLLPLRLGQRLVLQRRFQLRLALFPLAVLCDQIAVVVLQRDLRFGRLIERVIAEANRIISRRHDARCRRRRRQLRAADALRFSCFELGFPSEVDRRRRHHHHHPVRWYCVPVSVGSI